MVTGARQVGKYTMLQMIKKDEMNYVTLDDLDARSLAINDPKYFLEYYGFPLIIDEIQYAPNLLPYIKIIVDNEKLDSLKKNKKSTALFWLTGSQQFRLMKNISESLAGRVGVLYLYSLSLCEINKKQFNEFSPKIELLKKKVEKKEFKRENSLFQMIFNSGMPSIVNNEINRNDFFSSYINTYIERDIKELLNVGKTL